MFGMRYILIENIYIWDRILGSSIRDGEGSGIPLYEYELINLSEYIRFIVDSGFTLVLETKELSLMIPGMTVSCK